MTQSMQKNLTEDLTTQVCWECNGSMSEIIGHVESQWKSDPQIVRKGWYCFDCRTWQDAVLRERALEQEDLDYLRDP
jgi:hypothetical protein